MSELAETMEAQPDVDPIDAAVDAAFEGREVEEAPTPDPAAPAEEAEPREADPPKGPARDEKGKFVPREQKALQQPAVQPANETSPEPVISEAPRVLPPAVKEAWGALPAPVKDFIAKREGEAARRETETAEARKGYGEFQEAVAPYRHLFTEPPAVAVRNVMQTVAVLHTGTADQKAQLAARMVDAYGIPVEKLAHYLDNPGQAAQPQQQPQEYRDPRVDRLLAQQAQQQQLEVGAAVEAFEKTAEFIHSPGVRERMAQLVSSMPRAQGESVAQYLPRLYDAAVWSLPETREVLAKRPARGTAQAATPAAKRAAASSIRSSPAPVASASGKPRSLDAAFEAAWREQEERTR